MAVRAVLTTIFVMAGLSGHQAVATVKITLDTKAFAKTLSHLAVESRSCKEVRNDLREAQRRQNQMVDALVAANPDGKFYESYVVRGLLMHSLPLITLTDKEYSGTRMLDGLRFVVQGASLAKENLVHDAALNERVTKAAGDVAALPPNRYLDQYGEPFVSALRRYEFIGNPLVAWLIVQPLKSVSPLALVKQAMIYSGGNLFEALGTIGQLFDQERMHVYGPRRTLAVLGSRMQPFYSGDAVNPIGINYHFWSYLNMNLIHPSLEAKLFTWAFEKMYQGDIEEYAADKAGIDAGSTLHGLVKNRPHCNDIKANQPQK